VTHPLRSFSLDAFAPKAAKTSMPMMSNLVAVGQMIRPWKL